MTIGPFQYKVCSTMIEPREVLVPSKTTSRTYRVIPSTIWNDSVCECEGYRFRGTCSHITELEAIKCEWVDSSGELDIEKCPRCGAHTVVYEIAVGKLNEKKGISS